MMRLSPLSRRRLRNFAANRRGLWSLAIFTLLFVVSLFAEFIANDRPILVRYDGAFYCPILKAYPETAFGGEFATEADYKDPEVVKLIQAKGWLLWPAIPYGYDTIVKDLGQPAPSPPSAKNLLGTDDQARDVLGRLIYSFRISVLFGFVLTALGSVIGIAAGALPDLRRPDRPPLPAFRSLVKHAGALFADHHGGFIQPGFWWLLGMSAVRRIRLVALVQTGSCAGAISTVDGAMGISTAHHVRRLPNAATASLTCAPSSRRLVTW
jgi:microcin C transport system permease protein